MLLSLAWHHGKRPCRRKGRPAGIKKEIREKKILLNETRRWRARSAASSENRKKPPQKEANLASLTRQLNEVDALLTRTRREIEMVKAEADRKKQQIRVRLAAAVQGGRDRNGRIFFSSESFPQMAENLRYMKAILGNDRRLIAEYNEKIDRLSTLKKIWNGTLRARKREPASRSRKEKSRRKAEKNPYLVEVRVEKKGYQASLKELENNSRRLQAMVEKLDAKNRKSYSKHNGQYRRRTRASAGPGQRLRSQKGRLAMPAKGQMVGGFGRHKHPEFDSYTVSNGISIAASTGSDIRAVYDGQVIFADYFKGYGNMVIVDHGGGYFSLYAHAAKDSEKGRRYRYTQRSSGKRGRLRFYPRDLCCILKYATRGSRSIRLPG